MRRAFGITMMFLAMFSIAGGHWAILQTVAWTQMIRDYSKESGLIAGVAQTFSGERPCGMCKHIEKSRQQEEKAPASLKVDKKAEVFVASVTAQLRPPLATDFVYSSLDTDASSRAFAPPVPVPRA